MKKQASLQNVRAELKSSTASNDPLLRAIVMRPVADLKPAKHNARTHSKKQIKQIANAIRQFDVFAPIVIDENQQILAGHGRLEAAKSLGLTHVPTISALHLSEVKKSIHARRQQNCQQCRLGP